MKKTILPPSHSTAKLPPEHIEALYLTVARNPVDIAREVFSIRAHEILNKSRDLKEMVNSIEFRELKCDISRMTGFAVFREIMIDWVTNNIRAVKEDKSDWELRD